MSSIADDKQHLIELEERASSSSISTEDNERLADTLALQEAHKNALSTTTLWKDRIINLQFMLLNIVATVAIIFLNKTSVSSQVNRTGIF